MVAKRNVRAMVLVSLLATWNGTPTWADVITLVNSEVFQDLRVLKFDGQTRQFDIHSSGKTVTIPAVEVADIRFDPHPVLLRLTDGSLYSSIEVQQYDGNLGRFSIHRGAKVVDIKAQEVASIDFNPQPVPGGANGSIQAATTVSVEPGQLPPVLRPIHVAASPAAPASSSETHSVTTSSPPIAPPSIITPAEPLPPPPGIEPAEMVPPDEPYASDTEGDSPEGWDDDSLYSSLGENFGQPKTVIPGQTQSGYTARWKGSGAASGESLNKSGGKSEGSSAKKKTSTASKSKASPSRGGSKKKDTGASDKELSQEDQRTSDRSSRRNSRSGRDSDSRGGRGSSRYDSGSRSGGSNYGGSNYGGSRYGGGGYGGSNYGGSNYGGSRYGGGGYGGSNYGGSNYGGSRYGGGGYGSNY